MKGREREQDVEGDCGGDRDEQNMNAKCNWIKLHSNSHKNIYVITNCIKFSISFSFSTHIVALSSFFIMHWDDKWRVSNIRLYVNGESQLTTCYVPTYVWICYHQTLSHLLIQWECMSPASHSTPIHLNACLIWLPTKWTSHCALK